GGAGRAGRRGARGGRERRGDRGGRRGELERPPGGNLSGGRYRSHQRLPAGRRGPTHGGKDEHSTRHAGQRARAVRDRCVGASRCSGSRATGASITPRTITTSSSPIRSA